MTTLTDKTVALLLMGAKRAGTLDADDVMPFIGEQLTYEEYGAIEGFLRWMVNTRGTFGHGNIRTKFREYTQILRR